LYNANTEVYKEYAGLLMIRNYKPHNRTTTGVGRSGIKLFGLDQQMPTANGPEETEDDQLIEEARDRRQKLIDEKYKDYIEMAVKMS